MRDKRWRRAEKKVAESLGARVQPASGSLRRASMKADMRSPGEMRGENKYTTKDYFTLTARALDKLCRQSSWNETPTFSVVFQQELGTRVLILIPVDDVPTKTVKSSYRLRLSDAGEVIRFESAKREPVWSITEIF